jgi:hypothetical protein
VIERKYDISGALTFWALVPTPYQAFRDLLESRGYGKCVPNPRTDQSALQGAIKASYGTKDKTIVSRKRAKTNGVELLEIERREEHNRYNRAFGARVVEKQVKADSGWADEDKLTEEFLRSKAVLTTAAMGSALVAVLDCMEGIRGFCDPRLHYVPEHCLTEWKELARALKVCEEGNKIEVMEVAMNEGTARAVRDALTKRVNEEALQLLEDVSKGTLNDDQLQVRAKQAQELVQRVDLYSSILNEGLEGLKNVAALAQGAAMGAVMQDFAACGA